MEMIMKPFETELVLRGYSGETIRQYLYYNRDFLKFVRRPVRSVTKKDVKSYLEHLKLGRGVEPATLNAAISSLKYYFDVYLGKNLFVKISRCKLPKSLPEVLSKREIFGMIDSLSNLKHKILVELLYSSGLRVGEAVRIKVEDLDLEQRIARVKRGKGAKDRIVILSGRVCKHVKLFLGGREDYNPFLFNTRNGHFSRRTAQVIVKDAGVRAGIRRRVYPHALRSSFATHLLDSGVDISVIQELLGHERISTTQGYIRLSTKHFLGVKSPLDVL